MQDSDWSVYFRRNYQWSVHISGGILIGLYNSGGILIVPYNSGGILIGPYISGGILIGLYQLGAMGDDTVYKAQIVHVPYDTLGVNGTIPGTEKTNMGPIFEIWGPARQMNLLIYVIA